MATSNEPQRQCFSPEITRSSIYEGDFLGIKKLVQQASLHTTTACDKYIGHTYSLSFLDSVTQLLDHVWKQIITPTYFESGNRNLTNSNKIPKFTVSKRKTKSLIFETVKTHSAEMASAMNALQPSKTFAKLLALVHRERTEPRKYFLYAHNRYLQALNVGQRAKRAAHLSYETIMLTQRLLVATGRQIYGVNV